MNGNTKYTQKNYEHQENWVNTKIEHTKRQRVRNREFQSKMATEEASELICSCGRTKPTAPHGAIPHGRNPEASWASPAHWANEEHSHPNRRGRDPLSPWPPPLAQRHKQEHSQLQLPSEDKRFWTQHLVSQLLRLKAKRACIHKTHQTRANTS